MIASNLTADNARAILGSACDYLDNDELQAILDFWDEERGEDTELEDYHVDGWKRADTPSEICQEEMGPEEFEKMKSDIERELGYELEGEAGDYPEEAEELFMERAEERSYVISMDEHVWVKDCIYTRTYFLYQDKD